MMFTNNKFAPDSVSDAVKAILETGDMIPMQELSKNTLKSYVKGRIEKDTQRISGDSFRSGKAGDAYNNAPDDTRQDKNGKKGIDRALNKLAKEDVEDISELSKKTLGSYVNKAVSDVNDNSYATGRNDEANPNDRNNRLSAKLDAIVDKRKAGIQTAVKKLTSDKPKAKGDAPAPAQKTKSEPLSLVPKEKEAPSAPEPKAKSKPLSLEPKTKREPKKLKDVTKPRVTVTAGVKEEVEDISELAKETLSRYFHAAHKSNVVSKKDVIKDAGTEKGEEAKKKIQKRKLNMSLANSKFYKEEVEEIDELSQNKLDQYSQKALKSMDSAMSSSRPFTNKKDVQRKAVGALANRIKGIERAKRLSKEDVEISEEKSKDDTKPLVKIKKLALSNLKRIKSDIFGDKGEV